MLNNIAKIQLKMSENVIKSNKLLKIRELMKKYNYNCYLIPSNDAHDTEYVCNADKRLQFISNFSGENGTGI